MMPKKKSISAVGLGKALKTHEKGAVVFYEVINLLVIKKGNCIHCGLSVDAMDCWPPEQEFERINK